MGTATPRRPRALLPGPGDHLPALFCRLRGEGLSQQALRPPVPQHKQGVRVALRVPGVRQDRPAVLQPQPLQQGPQPRAALGPAGGAAAPTGLHPPRGPAVSGRPRPAGAPCPLTPASAPPPSATLDGTSASEEGGCHCRRPPDWAPLPSPHRPSAHIGWRTNTALVP